MQTRAIPGGEMNEQELMERVTAFVASVHPAPARLRTDREARDALIALYDFDYHQIWATLSKYFNENAAAFGALYSMHAGTGDDLFDLIELPLMLERLERDKARLRRAWPLAFWEYDRLPDLWAVRA